jgi:hypothetical protein
MVHYFKEKGIAGPPLDILRLLAAPTRPPPFTPSATIAFSGTAPIPLLQLELALSIRRKCKLWSSRYQLF